MKNLQEFEGFLNEAATAGKIIKVNGAMQAQDLNKKIKAVMKYGSGVVDIKLSKTGAKIQGPPFKGEAPGTVYEVPSLDMISIVLSGDVSVSGGA